MGQFGNSFAERHMSIGVLSLGVPWTARLRGSSMGHVQLHYALDCGCWPSREAAAMFPVSLAFAESTATSATRPLRSSWKHTGGEVARVDGNG